MKIVLDARLRAGVPGGIQQVILGTAAGLGQVEWPGDDLTYLVLDEGDEWLRPYVPATAKLRKVSGERSRTTFGRVTHAARRRFAGPRGYLPVDSDLEESGADVVHLLRQDVGRTEIPSIYHPYDLQHLHLPAFFSEQERRARELIYRSHCSSARFVVMMTEWSKADLCNRYDVDPRKVAVIPPAPFLRLLEQPSSEDIDRTRARFDLPAQFALYPAQTWPHKNHPNLFRALLLLRNSHEMRIPLVCCGTKNAHYENLAADLNELGLADQVTFIGWVDDRDLYGLYLAARCLIFPSLFEGWGMPVTEAFEVGLPVACSNSVWTPPQIKGAAVGFDPTHIEGIAGALAAVWSDEHVRARVVEEGRRRVMSWDWGMAASMFRSMYRAAGNRSLDERDEELLAQAGVSGWLQ